MESKLPPKIDIWDLVLNPRVNSLRESIRESINGNWNDSIYYAGYRAGYGGYEKDVHWEIWIMGYEDGLADRWEDLK